MENYNTETTTENNSKSKLLLKIILIIGFLVIVFYFLFSSPVNNKDTTIHVAPSDSLSKISNKLKSENVIRSPFSLEVLVYIFSGDRHISNGDYLFKKGKSVLCVAWQLSFGKHGVEPIRVTLKEGFTKEDMATLLADKIEGFSKDLFLSDERSKEGYLFPDTYFFYPMSTTDEILTEITSNFNKRIASVDKDIKSSGKSLRDIIIMASILEKEANGKGDSYVISGILWKRIKLGMPLQVDAVKSTYKENGLPENPISNPGLSSILSAIHPEGSPYLFYLHDDTGQVHYAVDFSQHRSNIAKYLK
ncbi:MAG: Aminodeoxychorismate lyase [Candidatus Nomurabacteria bacterium GW2011_GWF2_35_66]|uniref:Aminodeoxychorismate lyase n=1 Tax=Candidatus Nomurabacteria bacterium GW2011_GWE1_35_16 TaxID=1618761 RepID=A0A0G0EEB5_9BACT|nr:MAG: Aminodeoxychorismate lyase [Candidatus Nomurabacteria bacterium GW2011_GWF1_34_20]KKP63334.1 MAG: Aminodeoxychorismate lyase [Candidatus Nomurabacteria bacterium GW2011_GWE2_34_25]KKP65677.1 MAG: Aminodeoxychorismate lyase [Candidatus Nomurabacteria bacterium GW2011_GWE1_35_16]KKP83571.1 MAG: Aminodeoxychorismate lyase [Candidatus Nomurabacteria bacterium GW2011_GWF2_35_66]HAE36832.1 hypothetical protein [Candidatus Nomurabacteria bacterium]